MWPWTTCRPGAFADSRCGDFAAALDIDFLTGMEMRWQDGHEVNREWTIDRNSMFLELMRDFMDLAEGREPQENPLLPRLDLVMQSSALIARAWEARQFHGEINWSNK